MRAGTLTAQFSTEAGLGSAAIRYLTDSSISHVDLFVPERVALNHGCGPFERLLGARLDGGVKLRAMNYAKFTLTDTLRVAVPDIDAAYRFAFAQIGKPYNKGAIVDFFLHRTRKYQPLQKSWFCDELLYAICAAGGTLLLDTVNPLDLTPAEVLLSPKWTVG